MQAWRSFKASQQHLTETLTRVMAAWRSQTLAQAFAGWQEGVLAVQRKRLLLSKAVTIFNNRSDTSLCIGLVQPQPQHHPSSTEAA